MHRGKIGVHILLFKERQGTITERVKNNRVSILIWPSGKNVMSEYKRSRK